ncbi:hypothetical protein B0H16DRAFT_1480957 [Mycena metata]|uniref:CxC2-like cysteine cluster KDZ transposase-associated domain-containing protein n=1 Tax=Mycena metata TaxID=1033252 RepID=A0AAD7H0A5_9AGAR|nr:hypothetical protein B0H16DRAFT_1480957 [Mycena metata]
MSWLNLSSHRPPNRSQRNDDGDFEYETRPGEISRDVGFEMSQDGRRGVRTSLNVGLKKRKIKPSDLMDSFGDWMPLPGDRGVEDVREEEEEEGVEFEAGTGDKRQRYESSDDPMVPWRRLLQNFVDEIARRHGLADALDEEQCPCCATVYSRDIRRFRCTDCGMFTQCSNCVVQRHACHPLHRLRVNTSFSMEWNGSCWVPIMLEKVGLVYQLGHSGLPCRRPAPVVREMVVIGVDSIQTGRQRQQPPAMLRTDWYPSSTVDPATCATFGALELFRILNVIGNITVHDFVGALERQTDPFGVGKVPDRYKNFGRMARQYAFIILLLRAGRAHDPKGVANTHNGECAVLCWACPHDGRNLPDGWRTVAPEFRFLYMLLLAVDANFRLKNRLRANQHDDPPLGLGWGYQVEESAYKEHLKNYVAEKDVSTCIAFAALLQKDTRMTTGLRASGVGGVVCARHELMRPQGLGDLQKGERYANMDYILLSSVLGVTALYIAISYDIVCQWKVNFPERMAAMPACLQLDLALITLLFALPVWHALTHEESCQRENSLTYQVGVGRTDGEGIERTWSGVNPISWATKEMAPGGRHDAIENKLDHHNFEKNINLGTTLPRKLIIAIDERDRQVAAFQQVDSTLRTQLKRDWQKKIDDWCRDRTKPNPYEQENEGRDDKRKQSEGAIRQELRREEMEEAAAGAGAGVNKLHGSSITSFLVTGLQLEESQRVIRREARGRVLLAGDHQARLQEMRISFFSKLAGFRRLQAVYMVAAVAAVQAEENARDPDVPPPKAEDIKLYLPSGLTRAQQQTGCRKGLAAMEARLREGQCSDALKQLRGRLHTKKHLLLFREGGGAVGQRSSTRAQTLIERVDAAAAKYRRAREALIALRGAAACEGYRELKASDIELDEEREVDVAARQWLGNVGSKTRRRGPAISSKKKTFLWIWTGGGGPGEDEEVLHESVRVEWSKAKARKERWEEVQLLREEMKRVLRFLRWRALWWETRRGMRNTGVSRELAAGLQAYAARQASLHRDIARKFKAAWETSAATAVRVAIWEDNLLQQGMEVFGEITAVTEPGGSGDGE